MTLPTLPIVVLLLTALAATSAVAESLPEYSMERTQVRSMKSTTGAEYRIYVGWPDTPPSAAGYPAMLVLDGDDNFPTAAITVQRMERFADAFGVSPGLVIGIGYQGESRRSLDYTPESGIEKDGQVSPAGGAAQFRSFLREVLLPALKQDFKLDSKRLTLFGHSFGGLFVLDTLFDEPDLFRTYVASSPSIWYSDRVILESEKGLADKLEKSGPRTLVLTVGEFEQAPPPWVAGSPVWKDRQQTLTSRRMVDDNRELAQRLSAVPGLEVDHRVLSGETHGTAMLPAIGNALRFAYGSDSP